MGREPAFHKNKIWPGTMLGNAAGEAMKKRPVFVRSPDIAHHMTILAR